jgi:hypothetical protein
MRKLPMSARLDPLLPQLPARSLFKAHRVGTHPGMMLRETRPGGIMQSKRFEKEKDDGMGTRRQPSWH